MMTPSSSLRPSAARRLRLPLIATVVALLWGAGLAGAQSSGWYAAGALDGSDPTWQRPYLFNGQCYLSTVGSNVFYDVHELILDTPIRPIDLTASLCAGTQFDSVLFFYQRSDGHPGPFAPGSPCANLIAYNDDYCGSASRIDWPTLVPGVVAVVVTAFANGEAGAYQAWALSSVAHLGQFIFYGGFETGDSRTWSQTVVN
jgi:hypothetical protein